MTKTPVVILGLYDTGLYVAQSIARYRIPVLGFDYNENNPGFFSRYIDSFYAPHPYFSPEELFKQLLLKAGELSAKPVLIPSSEEYIGFINRFRNDLKESFHFIIPEEEIILKILNKRSQFEMADNSGLNIPGYSTVNSKNELDDFLSEYEDSKVIIKALEQVEWKSKVKKKAFIADNYDDISGITNKLLESETSFIIQNIVDGECTNNYEFNALMINGEITESCVIQKLRQYPPGYGTASCIHTTENNIVYELGKKFIIQNGIEGFSNTEFKFNPVDEKYYFIETNARVWQQIRLTESIGQNFVRSYYNHFSGEPEYSKVKKTKRSVKWIDFFSDSVLWWRYLRQHKFGTYKYLLTMKNVKNFGLLNISDLRPFFHALSEIFMKR